MKNIYEKKISNLIQNYEVLGKSFKWENDLVKHLVSLTFTMENKEISEKEIEEIKEMKEYIKDKTSVFSNFRGYMLFSLAGMLVETSNDPKRQFDIMLENEEILKSVGFKSSPYLPTTLYALSNAYTGEDVKGYAEKAMDIYKEMKNNHPFLTNRGDYVLAVLLAGRDTDIDNLEHFYKKLDNNGLSKSNGLQMLSHILVFSERNVDDTVKSCMDIYNYLKENKLKVYPDYYPAIGILSLLDIREEVKSDLVEIAHYLKIQKKYKWLGKGMNVLIASSLITSEYIRPSSKDGVVSSSLNVSIQSIIAAQQAAMIGAMVAASSAAAASSS